MQLRWLGLALTVVLVVGCEAKIDGGASFSAQSGGDMMDDDDGTAGSATADDGRRSDVVGDDDDDDESAGGSGAGSSDSGGSSAQAGSAPQPGAGTGASGAGGAMAPEEIEPNPNVGGPYDLGTLPSGFSIDWPAEPVITREVEVFTAEEFVAAASVAGTRVLVRQDLQPPNGFLQTGAIDLEIRVDPGVVIDGTLEVGRNGRQRIRVIGGHYRAIMTSPVTAEPLTEDVMFDGVTVNAEVGSAIMLRGRRIAVIRSTVTAEQYSVYSDAASAGGVPNTDIILAGNVMRSLNEATIRIISAANSATVDNRLSNTGKHNYRVHGQTGQSYAARNVLITSGTMLATMPGDTLAEAWFDENVFYHTTPDLFHPEAAAVTMLHARDNTVYSDVWSCFYCSAMPPTWDLQNNQMMPYQPPP